MAQTRQSDKAARTSETSHGPAPSASLTHTAKRLNRTIDQLVDEIDDVLEQNAEEFVKGYVQRGGQ